MRFNYFGDSIAQPGDTADIVFDAWGDFTPVGADIYDQMDEVYFYGGEAFDDDGNRQTFDGFESVDDARTFAVETLGIPANRIEVLEP